MKILDLHQFERFRNVHSVKVLRHKELSFDLWEKRETGQFGHYQDGQSWDIFGSARYIISFIAERNRCAKFVGVWEVISKRKKKPRGFKYKTKELPGFKDLEGRLIIQWGEGAKSWAQWLHRKGNKHIVELLPSNYVMDFPGYYKFALSYDKLAKMVNNPDSNREWQRMLSSARGVYLVLDKCTGKQYVGSAYGVGGIWARWKSYVKSRSGGNARLKKVLKRNPTQYKQFQFSILRVLEPSATKKEIIGEEVITKKKLGSNSFGLNSN